MLLVLSNINSVLVRLEVVSCCTHAMKQIFTYFSVDGVLLMDATPNAFNELNHQDTVQNVVQHLHLF